MRVNILGTEYEIIKSTRKTDPALVDADGYIDTSIKTIVLDESNYGDDPRLIKDMNKHKEIVLRHELIHALFHESGLESYEKDEVLVQWIAMQLPKINEIIKQVTNNME